MAMKTKSGKLFYDDRLIAMMQGAEYTIMTNDGQEITVSGPFNTDGIALTKVTCNILVPVKGAGIPITKDALEHKDVKISLACLDGSFHELLDARAQELVFTMEVEKGAQKGRFTWHAGIPKVSAFPQP